MFNDIKINLEVVKLLSKLQVSKQFLLKEQDKLQKQFSKNEDDDDINQQFRGKYNETGQYVIRPFKNETSAALQAKHRAMENDLRQIANYLHVFSLIEKHSSTALVDYKDLSQIDHYTVEYLKNQYNN
jgi:hypothetical protein